MSVKIGSARIDENGKAKGGKAGDQTGKEVSIQNWYKHSKGWRVFRAKSAEVAEKIAQDMEWACANKHIGYDQGQRLTLYNVARPLGFNCKKVTTNCETDCSALVRVCCAYAGVTLPNFRTPTEPAALLDSGAFTELKGSRYTDSSAYLKRGDILVTKTQGHTVVVLSNGSKADADDGQQKLGDRTLKKGCEGDDVKELQLDLLKLGYSLPKYGADGEFGSETEKAVKAFQLAHGLADDGVMNKGKDFEALAKALEALPSGPQRVEITGHVNIRSAPGYDSKVLGTANKGDVFPYQGVSREAEGRPWYLIEYKGGNAWVSGKYASLIDGGGLIRGSKIVDLSKYQPTIDYDALIADTALIILRAGYRSKDGGIYEDQKFRLHAGELTKRGVRFGVFFYSIATDEARAQEEARLFWKYARDFRPLFWAMDAEKDGITKDTILAFVTELRRLGAERVGCYVANHLYTRYDYAAVRDRMDFTWIPRYSDARPDYPCDLWQYTDEGRVNGIDKGVDLNRITGQGHTLTWFCGGETRGAPPGSPPGCWR